MGKHAASDQKNYGVPGARNIEQQGKGKIAARRQSTGQRAAHYVLNRVALKLPQWGGETPISAQLLIKVTGYNKIINT